MLVLPFGLVLTRAQLAHLAQPREALAAAALGLGLLAAAAWVFVFEPPPGLLLLAPLIIVATLRFGLLGAAAGSLWSAVLVVGFSLAGLGPLGAARGELHDAMIWLQGSIAMLALTTLPVAAVLAQRDRFELELRDRRRAAEAASETKSRLLANLSHELRTPLNAVTNLSGLMLGGVGGPLNPQQREMLASVADSADQLEVLAGDLTAYARAESGEAAAPQRIALDEAAAAAFDRARAKAAAGGAVLRLLAPSDWTPVAWAAPESAARILDELVENALEHGGGHVEVAFSRPAGPFVRIEIRDRGSGVPETRRHGLFEPFNRFGKEDGRYSGAGVGLALARRLARSAGGEVDFVTTAGRGSIFWVDLPVPDESPG